MLKHKRIIILSLSILLILVVGVFAAFAQEDSPTPPYGRGMMNGQGMGMMGQHGMMNGQGMGMMGAWNSTEHPMFVAIAEALGLSTDELLAELQAGKTVVGIAEERAIDIQTVYDAALAAHQAHLAAQVEAGTITQEQADANQAWMEANIANHHIFTGTGMMGDCPMGLGNGTGYQGQMGRHGMGRGRW